MGQRSRFGAHDNQYNEERWNGRGVEYAAGRIRVTDLRQRLVVTLVQKKINEVLQQERFSASFQIGMLASFESFLETAKLKKADDDVGVFDDAEQTGDALEKEGADVADLNLLARSYRERFQSELPHPKMDALVGRLASAWKTGEKSLVFVRRVASVRELKRKLDEAYWLIARLRDSLPAKVQKRFNKVLARYQRARLKAIERRDDVLTSDTAGIADAGGSALFLRGSSAARDRRV